MEATFRSSEVASLGSLSPEALMFNSHPLSPSPSGRKFRLLYQTRRLLHKHTYVSQGRPSRGRPELLSLLCIMQVSSNGKGFGAAWHLSHAEVVNTGTNEKLTFPFDGWIDKEHGLEHMLYPDRDGDGVGDASVAASSQIEYEVRQQHPPAQTVPCGDDLYVE